MTPTRKMLMYIGEILGCDAPGALKCWALFEDIAKMAENGDPLAQKAMDSLDIVHKLVFVAAGKPYD